MTWETVRLGDVIAAVTGRAGELKLPVYSVTKHRGFVPSHEYFNKRVFSKDLSTYKTVARGQFAYATIHLDEGSIGIAPELCLISPMYTAFSVDATRVDPDYLIRYLKSPTAIAHYATLGRGTAERRKSISLSALGRLHLPLPPLPEQRRIAAILDQADALRIHRRQALKALAVLRNARFAEIFTEHATTARLSDYVSRIESGHSPTCLARPAHDDEWGVLKLGAVTTGQYLPEQNKAVQPTYTPRAHLEVAIGDILLSRKNTLDLVGASVYVRDTPPNRLLPDLIFRLVPSDDTIASALQAYLALPQTRAKLSALAGGSASSMSNISKQRLATLAVPTFSPELVSTVAQLAGEADRAYTGAISGLTALDALFASLQYRAFRGEL